MNKDMNSLDLQEKVITILVKMNKTNSHISGPMIINIEKEEWNKETSHKKKGEKKEYRRK